MQNIETEHPEKVVCEFHEICVSTIRRFTTPYSLAKEVLLVVVFDCEKILIN